MKHRQEIRFEMLKQSYEQHLQLMKDAASVSGRPMFHVKLSREEQLQRWDDPLLRKMFEQDLLQSEGPEAVIKYREDMLKLRKG